MFYIYSYIAGSRSVKALKAKAGDALRVIRRGPRSRFRGTGNKLVVNWGASAVPDTVRRSRVVNNPVAVGHASNKVIAFRIMDRDPKITVDYTESREVALQWIAEGHTVVARTLLSAHEGRGIVLVTRAEELPPGCRLFTKYKKKAREFRVHVFNGQTLVHEKKKRRGQASHMVRNTANGYVFARNPENVPASTVDVARLAVERLGLTFGAVDVIYNQRENKSYVLEVNTAPGIETSTVDWYIERFNELV